MVYTTTYITAFIDLPRLEINKTRRSFETYKRVASELLTLNTNIVYIGDIEMGSFVNQFRTEKGMADKTKIISLTYEELPYYKYSAKITDIVKSHGIFGETSCHRYTPSYIVTILSKLPLLHRISCENPFNTTHFCWIDFGYFHLKEGYPHMFTFNKEILLSEIDSLWSESLFKIQMIQPPGEHTVKMSIRQLFSVDRNTLAGGMFGGSHSIIEWITEQQEATVKAALADNCIANEEMILSSILYRNPERFDLNGAYYASILQNFATVRMNIGKVIPVLQFANKMGWNNIVNSLCRRLLAGHQHRYITLSADILNLIYSIYLKYCPPEKVHAIKLASECGGARWKYNHNIDSIYGDIRRITPPFTLPDLIEAAENTPGCIGFTSSGWLKRSISLRPCDRYAPGEGIYILQR